MKTAISVDGQLLDEADRTAKQMGLSRSGLFSVALRDFLRQRQQTEMLAQLNEVYRDADTSAERRMAGYLKNKLRSTIKENW
jgi:metal-responsive CopG/Arc/MetJ family transcriptional regulator